MSKRKLKKEYTISSGTKKNMTPQAHSATLHLEEWIRYLRHRHSIKLSKNKIDSKFIKYNQCSLEKSHAKLIELNSEF